VPDNLAMSLKLISSLTSCSVASS